MNIREIYKYPIVKNIVISVLFGGASYLLGLLQFSIP